MPLYDWVRLFATVLVVIGHSCYLKIKTGFGGVDYVIPSELSAVYYNRVLNFTQSMAGWAYGFHMPLFFVLSGAVLALKPMRKLDLLCVNKAKRLIVPYFIAGLLFLFPVKYAGNFYTRDSLLSAINTFWQGGDSGHLWFLPALFWCIVCFAFLYKMLSRFGVKSHAVVLIASILIAFYSKKISFDILGLKTGLSYIHWFSIGWVFEHYRKNAEKIPLGRVFLFFLIVLLGEEIDKKCGFLFFNAAVRTLFGIAFSFLLAMLVQWLCTAVNYNLPCIITRNLFAIYLFHDPLEYIVLRFAFGRGHLLFTATGCYLYLFMRTVGIFIFSMLLGEAVLSIKRICLRLISAQDRQ